MSIFGTSWKTKFNKETEFQREQLQAQQDFSERMWNAQNDWNLSQWNREVEYNDPSNVLARMMDAGINPNNATQQIAGQQNSAPEMQTQQASSPTTPGAPDPTGTDEFSNFAQLGSKAMDLYKYLDTERKNNQADTELKKSEVENNKQELKKMIMEYEEIMPQQVKYWTNMVDKVFSETNLNRKEYEYKTQLIKNAVAEEAKTYQEVAESKKRVDELDAKINLLEQQLKTEVEVTKRTQLEQELTRAKTDRERAETTRAQAAARLDNLHADFEEKLQKNNQSTYDPYGSGQFGNAYNTAKSAGRDIANMAMGMWNKFIKDLFK